MSSNVSPEPQRIVFIGGGNMARSLIGGMIARGVPAANIAVVEPVSAARNALSQQFGVSAVGSPDSVAGNAGIVVLAVKPQVMRSVCAALHPLLPANALLVSVAAGIRSDQIDHWTGGERAIVRVMPNTPALLGAGAAGLYANSRVSQRQRQDAESLMQSTGLVRWIDEEARMDAVTALSGSGPAYVFLLAEAMQAAAEAQGLDADTARALAAQTVLGAARMLTESGEEAAELRRRVTSPNGTTHAAIQSFEDDGFRAMVDRAIKAATERGRSLSAEFGDAADDRRDA
ncbi:MAG: pyrroline-5-carboxylate reductase [Xanthomonadales bacterium]|nr:pyrroline-5-carboxylate reductase [Xanthomonadales bacterium]